MIKVGILGAAGYTGGELLRLLLAHPFVSEVAAYSRSQAGKQVREIHDDLHDLELVFQAADQIWSTRLDVLFLALGHGESKKWISENRDRVLALTQEGSFKLIDLTQDFRVVEEDLRAQNPEFPFIYGLPEVNREQIRSASFVANPGCFATALQLSLLPFRQYITDDVQITGITGSTGAGQNPVPTTHYSWRSENVQPYKVLTHQHLHEVRHTLGWTASTDPKIHFTPWRGPFSRGILVSAYLKWQGSQAEAMALASEFFASHPFVQVQDSPVHLRQVVGTNVTLISLTVEEGCLVVHTALDNLLKGASGQAVQNMNLMTGLDETSGLRLKTVR